MTSSARLAGPLALLLGLVACSSGAAPGTPNGPTAADAPKTGEPGSANDVGGGAPVATDGELATLDLVATGLDNPTDIVAQGGNAYITSGRGLVMVSGSGDVEKLDEYAPRIASDGTFLAWLSVDGGLTSAPFANLGLRTVAPSGGVAMSLAAYNGTAFVTLAPTQGSSRNGGPLLRSELGKTTAPQAVTTNVAMNYATIAADATHVYYFAPPNEDSVEVRRVPIGGGVSERIGYVSAGNGEHIALSDKSVFFGVRRSMNAGAPLGGGLYAVPKSGGVAPTSVFARGAPVAGFGGMYFASSEEDLTQIYFVDDAAGIGAKPRLLAQHFGSSLMLAVDATGVYALSSKEGALYKLSKR